MIYNEIYSCVLLDIDGTIALDKLGGIIPTDFTREGWNSFHKNMDMYNTDRFIPILSTILLAKSSGLYPIFLTAREDVGGIRENTSKFIQRYFGARFKLYMRSKNDFRPSSEVKKDIILRDILPNYRITCAFDDEEENIKMLQQLGITAYKVCV